MALYLEIIEGSFKGTRHGASKGVRIGRSSGDILVDDPKVSSDHAYIDVDAKGALVLIDNGSSNGIIVNKARVKKLLLLPGISFQLGRTIFKVFETDETEEEISPSDWRKQLQKHLIQNSPRFAEKPEVLVQAFNPPLRLVFLEGRQADTVWTLGYGPRQFGYETLELRIQDEQALPLCFELKPTNKTQALFTTDFPKRVKLNDSAISSKILEPGDIISVGETKIRIDFIET